MLNLKDEHLAIALVVAIIISLASVWPHHQERISVDRHFHFTHSSSDEDFRPRP